MCCHTGMPCSKHKAWHPTLSQYTDTGPTCHCAIHWCGTSHWKYPFWCLGSDPTGKSFPDLPHTPAYAQLYDGSQLEAPYKEYCALRVLNPRSVICKSIMLSARPQLLFTILHDLSPRKVLHTQSHIWKPFIKCINSA